MLSIVSGVAVTVGREEQVDDVAGCQPEVTIVTRRDDSKMDDIDHQGEIAPGSEECQRCRRNFGGVISECICRHHQEGLRNEREMYLKS